MMSFFSEFSELSKFSGLFEFSEFFVILTYFATEFGVAFANLSNSFGVAFDNLSNLSANNNFHQQASHIPVIPVVIGMVMAPLAVLFRRSIIPYYIAILSTFIAFICSFVLFLQYLSNGVLNYNIGNWAPPVGINLVIDGLSSMVLLLISFIAFISIIFSLPLAKKEIGRDRLNIFYALMLICITGLMGVIISGDAFNIFVFIEISSISTYALVSFSANNNRRALTAAFNYLILGTLGATFYVIGVGLLYQATGQLNLELISYAIKGLSSNSLHLGFIFILIGLSLKAALFPLHSWLPNAYAFAPSTVSVLLSATSTKMALYVMLRYIFMVFDVDNVTIANFLGYILLPLALIGVIITSLIACFQNDVKKILAYSSIGQVGYILIGIALLNEASLTGSIMHIVFHSLMKCGLFMAAACVIWRTSGSSLVHFSGLFYKMPIVSICFAILGVSIIGLPPTFGFATKWYLLSGGFSSGNYLVPIIILLSSLLAVVYMGRIFKVMIFTRSVNKSGQEHNKRVPVVMLVPLVILTIFSLSFVFGDFGFIDFAGHIASQLLPLGESKASAVINSYDLIRGVF